MWKLSLLLACFSHRQVRTQVWDFDRGKTQGKPPQGKQVFHLHRSIFKDSFSFNVRFLLSSLLNSSRTTRFRITTWGSVEFDIVAGRRYGHANYVPREWNCFPSKEFFHGKHKAGSWSIAWKRESLTSGFFALWINLRRCLAETHAWINS